MGDRKTVLVAQKDSDIRKIVLTSLESQEYRILIANSVEEISQVTADNPVDAMIISLELLHESKPGESLKALRHLTDSEHCPTVILAPQNRADKEEEISNAGADFFLTEPISPKDIIYCLRGLFHSATPKTESKVKLKRKKAKDILLKVAYQTKEGFINCYLRNIIEDRCFVDAPKKALLLPGSRFIFEVTPPIAEPPFTVVGTVRSINLYEDFSGMGIQFEIENQQDERRFQKLALRLRKEMDAI